MYLLACMNGTLQLIKFIEYQISILIEFWLSFDNRDSLGDKIPWNQEKATYPSRFKMPSPAWRITTFYVIIEPHQARRWHFKIYIYLTFTALIFLFIVYILEP